MTTVTITNDTQMAAIAGICAARLNRLSAGSCNGIVLYTPPAAQAATKAPLLFAYRTSEKMERKGTSAKIVRVVSAKLLYVLAPTGSGHLEAAAGVLAWAVQGITDALLDAKDVDYESGATLETLASITEAPTVDFVTYQLDLELPQVELAITVRHVWARGATPSVVIAEMVGDLNLNLDRSALAWQYAADKWLYLTPLRAGVYVTVDTGTELAVLADGPRLSLVAVAGETTLVDMSDAIANNEEASALLELTGDAGVLFAAPLPHAVTVALSRPLAEQISDTSA